MTANRDRLQQIERVLARFAAGRWIGGTYADETALTVVCRSHGARVEAIPVVVTVRAHKKPLNPNAGART